jgi:hypothetical protein
MHKALTAFVWIGEDFHQVNNPGVLNDIGRDEPLVSWIVLEIVNFSNTIRAAWCPAIQFSLRPDNICAIICPTLFSLRFSHERHTFLSPEGFKKCPQWGNSYLPYVWIAPWVLDSASRITNTVTPSRLRRHARSDNYQWWLPVSKCESLCNPRSVIWAGGIIMW